MSNRAMRHALTALMMGCLILAATGGSAGPTERVRLPPPPDPQEAFGAPPELRARQEAIAAELQRIGPHAWAGEYADGDGLGANRRVWLAPQAGIAGTLSGCLGLYDSRLGSVVESTGVLKLQLDRTRDTPFSALPDELVPVRWGQRRYLIAPSELISFVNAIHQGFEPRTDAHGMFLLGRGDEEKPAEGLPDLPERYRSAIRSAALDVGVIAVEPSPARCDRDGYCTRTYRFTVDRGSLDGIATGMELQVKSPDNQWDHLLIESTDGTTAVGELITRFDADDKPDVEPDRRWVFTTGSYSPVAR
ncbi:hypothetical protein ACFW0P_04105 [Lysobacter soli]|uniref:hypothetical protein n=1 Tax=Lysobacter soli TaxID=453783 RepID=UPI00368DE976